MLHQAGINLLSVEHGIPYRAHNVATSTFAAMVVSPSAHAAPQIQYNVFILHHADVEIQNRGNPRCRLLEMSMRTRSTHHCKLPQSVLPLLLLPTGKLNHLPIQVPHFWVCIMNSSMRPILAPYHFKIWRLVLTNPKSSLSFKWCAISDLFSIFLVHRNY